MIKKVIYCFVVLILFNNCGGEKSDDNTVAKAQACLDTATQSTAGLCEAMVNGISGSKAEVIHCSAKFLTEGFTSARFANAFTQLNITQPAGTNTTTAMLSYLIFYTGGLVASQAAQGDCSQTGLKGMKMFGDMAVLATVLAVGYAIPLGSAISVTTYQTALKNLAGFNTTYDALVGTTATSVSQGYCATGSTTNAQFCTVMNAAISSGTPAQVGLALRTALASP